MKQVTATRRVQFCAGHRVHQHESKCRNLHGHNYVAFFTAVGLDSELDPLGRVIDFSVLKQKLGGWVDEKWDHGFIVWEEDTDALAALAKMGDTQKLFLLDKNPTAENMARYLLETVGPECLRGTGVTLIKVTLWETENCYAEVE
jgi:6-pyruvoyltetrahydropterin/6-carboxytetrahydropterin synthase